MRKATIIFITILSTSINLFSQNIKADILRLQKVMQPTKKVDNNYEYTHALKDANNELQLIASFLFVSYKLFVSSQDVDACVFTPSCSVYAIETIKKHGILGIFDASDRLQRCHPGANGHYPIDKKTGKLYDPVK